MKFKTMWKDYYKEVLVPAGAWFKRYWKEYGLISLILGVGVAEYLTWDYYDCRKRISKLRNW